MIESKEVKTKMLSNGLVFHFYYWFFWTQLVIEYQENIKSRLSKIRYDSSNWENTWWGKNDWR